MLVLIRRMRVVASEMTIYQDDYFLANAGNL